jgi:hypothetical protein
MFLNADYLFVRLRETQGVMQITRDSHLFCAVDWDGQWAGGPSFAERRVGARFLAGTAFLSLNAHASQR